jgi:cytochrome P450
MNGKTGLVMSLVAFGVGSAVMYFCDPNHGRRRRDHARHFTRKTVRRAQKMADETSRRLEKVSHMDLGDMAKMLVPISAKALLWR